MEEQETLSDIVERMYMYTSSQLRHHLAKSPLEKKAIRMMLDKGNKRQFYEVQQELLQIAQNEVRDEEEKRHLIEKQKEQEKEVLKYERLHREVLRARMESIDSKDKELKKNLSTYKRTWKNMKKETQKRWLDELYPALYGHKEE